MVKEAKELSAREAEKIVLKPGEIVQVKPIIRKRPFFKEGHDGEFMFTGTTKTYQLPYDMSTHSYVRIFEDPDVQEAFEVLLNKPKGSLNIYDWKNKFWRSYSVEVTKEGKELDLGIPGHVLEYFVLKANKKRIAEDWASRHKPGLEFALVNDAQVREDDNKRADIYENAMDLFFKVRKKTSDMYNILRLLDKKPLKENRDNAKWLKTELLKIIEQKDKTPKSTTKTVHDFIRVVEDPKFDTKVLIYDAMDKNEIKLRSGMFILTSTDAPMGKSLTQAADYIDNLENHEEKVILQQRIKDK